MKPLRFSIATLLLIVSGLCVYLAIAVPRPNQYCYEQTGREFDLAIIGEGFFCVTDSTGKTFFTRQGRFELNANDQLVLAGDKFKVDPPMTIPSVDAARTVITDQGAVIYRTHEDYKFSMVNSFLLAKFVAPQHLQKQRSGLYSATAESGIPIMQGCGEHGAGYVMQGWREVPTRDPLQLFLIVPGAIACGAIAGRVMRR